MTDYKEKYEELLDANKRLKEELDSLKSNAEDYNDPDLKNGGNKRSAGRFAQENF
jgi:hypothetical protein